VIIPLESPGGRAPGQRWLRVSPLPGRAAFSLIEMLIALVLVIIMAIMLNSSGSRSNQQRQMKSCQQNLQSIYLALEIYANEHSGLFPVLAGAQASEEPLSLLVPRYTVATDRFICPGSKDAALPTAEPLAGRRISYAYFMGRALTNDPGDSLMTDRQIHTEPKPKGAQVFSNDGKAPGNNHHKYGGNYLFVDGRLEQGVTLAPVPMLHAPGVVLLNPKP
jgi:type II secretory pathway pseudopilin PulG